MTDDLMIKAEYPLDSLLLWALGSYPKSSISLAQTTKGEWFVLIKFGDEFNSYPGLFGPLTLEVSEVEFFSSKIEAKGFAYNAIKEVFPELNGRYLDSFYS